MTWTLFATESRETTIHYRSSSSPNRGTGENTGDVSDSVKERSEDESELPNDETEPLVLNPTNSALTRLTLTPWDGRESKLMVTWA